MAVGDDEVNKGRGEQRKKKEKNEKKEEKE